jgi:hypothetical protein
MATDKMEWLYIAIARVIVSYQYSKRQLHPKILINNRNKKICLKLDYGSFGRRETMLRTEYLIGLAIGVINLLRFASAGQLSSKITWMGGIA